MSFETVLPDRIPPQSIDAEQATLGAALISRGAVEPLDAAVGLLVAYAAAYATTEGLIGDD